MSGDNCIVIDLDDTMLNTKKMYDDLIEKELSHFGVTPEIFWKAGNQEFKSRSGLGMYSFENHFDILGKDLGVDEGELEKMKLVLRSAIISSSGKYLFPDVADFLDSYHRQARIIILTKGQDHLQSWKISGLKRFIDVKRFFAEVVITKEDKGAAIDELCSEKNRLNVFIDDSAIQINSVIKARPDIVTMFVRRKSRRVNKEKHVDLRNIDFDYEVANLKEADDILSEMI